jgi:hypothetical protein
VDLVVLEHLALGKVEHDRASLIGRGEDLRVMGPPGEAFEIPVIHRRHPVLQLDEERSPRPVVSRSHSLGLEWAGATARS